MVEASREWPAWPEYTEQSGEKGEDLISYKQAVMDKYGKESLISSWLQVCKELAALTDRIVTVGSEAIPSVQFEDLFKLDHSGKQVLKDVGCFVVRNVVAPEKATEWFDDLKLYVAKNRSSIGGVCADGKKVGESATDVGIGWPTETPFILQLYFSPTQIAARSHPNQLKLSRELNSWWNDAGSETASAPLSYADAIRIRPPKIPFYGLGPHIDAGSLSRWADPTYQSVYSAVFSGHPEQLDNYDLSLRKDAKQAFFPGSAHSRVFRSFQGWTALTGAGPGEGSLMLYPNVKWTIAYVLLRPFFQAPKDGDILDATRWTFDCDSAWFPGTFKADSQMLSPSSHPHLRLKECMVPIPRMYAGDTIWWHADMCHAVEVEHNGEHDASVAYVAATPSTAENERYIKGQLEDFLRGVPPEDFRGGSNERDFDGFSGEQSILSGDEGRRAMGFELLAAA